MGDKQTVKVRSSMWGSEYANKITWRCNLEYWHRCGGSAVSQLHRITCLLRCPWHIRLANIGSHIIALPPPAKNKENIARCFVAAVYQWDEVSLFLSRAGSHSATASSLRSAALPGAAFPFAPLFFSCLQYSIPFLFRRARPRVSASVLCLPYCAWNTGGIKHTGAAPRARALQSRVHLRAKGSSPVWIRHPAECEPRRTAVQVWVQTHILYVRPVKCAAGQSRHRCPCVWVHPSLTHPKFPEESRILLHELCSGWVQHRRHLSVSLAARFPLFCKCWRCNVEKELCPIAAAVTRNLESARIQQQPLAFLATLEEIML